MRPGPLTNQQRAILGVMGRRRRFYPIPHLLQPGGGAVTVEKSCRGCDADISGTHGKQEWCSEKCRKDTLYGGKCEGCGARTNGNNGPGTAARRCVPCTSDANRKWTRDRILTKIHEWAERYGQPPVASDWNPALAPASTAKTVRARYEGGGWPSTTSVSNYWLSWNEAIRAAGFTPRHHGSRRSAALAADQGEGDRG
jgi:hypothetical protein